MRPRTRKAWIGFVLPLTSISVKASTASFFDPPPWTIFTGSFGTAPGTIPGFPEVRGFLDFALAGAVLQGILIGGTTAAARNIISGNFKGGIKFTLGTNNFVEGNYIGLSRAGESAVANNGPGIVMRSSALGCSQRAPASGCSRR